MRRTWHKAFKGSISAVLDSIESAKKKLMETPKQKYKDIDLLILFKGDYFARNNKENKIKWKLNYELNKSKKKNKS